MKEVRWWKRWCKKDCNPGDGQPKQPKTTGKRDPLADLAFRGGAEDLCHSSYHHLERLHCDAMILDKREEAVRGV